ncbi:5-formyltetrahydrofolate cyclo-ligase [Bermanella sp. R86510]|uniref:5-formyltetrahydrofolate cyclo-ligase n=1 Tax=unclassified Bermanella TaxID=2627862 RepID=UPI0037C54DCA
MDFDITDRQAIRQYMRAQRNALSNQQQLSAAKRIAQNAMASAFFVRAQNIAVYLANDGEVDPIVLAERGIYRGKQCYLPILDNVKKGFLQFADYRSPRKKNRFGIAEPISQQTLSPKQLDLVFLPLVAFDRQGGRLGMGGGFYDRTFAFLSNNGLSKPKLIGLAHSLQEVDGLPLEDWDVPLHAVITEQDVIITNS